MYKVSLRGFAVFFLATHTTVGEQKRGDIKEYNFNIIILSIVFYDIEFPLLPLLSRIIYTYALYIYVYTEFDLM